MRRSNITPRRFIKSRSIQLPQPVEPEPDSSLDAGRKPARRSKPALPKKAKPASTWWFNVTYRGQTTACGKTELLASFKDAKPADCKKLETWLKTCKAGDSVKIGAQLVECKLSPDAEPAFDRDKANPNCRCRDRRPSDNDPMTCTSCGGFLPLPQEDMTPFEKAAAQLPSLPLETINVLPTAEMCDRAVSLTDRLRGGNFQQLLAQRRAEIDLDAFQAHGRTPTSEQRAALSAALEGPAVLVLEAGAGTGKTSSFQMLAQVLPGNGQYCSFGKAQTDDAKPKFAGTKVAVNTTHSLAFRAVGHQFADRLGGKRVRAEEVARMLGLGEFKLTVEVQQKDGTKVPSERALAPGFLAGQVMGAVRRWCQGADREVTVEHFKYIDGIDLPEASGKRTYGNNRAVAEYLVPYARKAWADLSDPKGQLPYWPDCYVKLWQLSDPVIAADYILCDECFPEDTSVQTDLGPVPIRLIADHPERIWRVLASQDGGKTLYYSQVTSAYRTLRAGSLVEIRHEQGTIICTGNHPFWVEGQGWKAAGLLRSGDCLSRLWPAKEQGSPNMLYELWSDFQESQPNSDCQGSNKPESSRGAGPKKSEGRGRKESEDLQANEGGSQGDSESLLTAGGQSEDLGYDEGQGSHFLIQRGQWNRADRPRVDVVQAADSTPVKLAMEPRVCHLQWTAYAEGPANLLQDRRSFSQENGSDRDRRGQSQEPNQKTGRQEEGFCTTKLRVDCIQVYQPGSGDRPSSDSQEDHQWVYTLSTEAGSYFAAGVLVKNCQDSAEVWLDIMRQQLGPDRKKHPMLVLCGDSAQQIYAWRGAVNAMASFPDAPRLFLSQSFRFGEAIAQAANSVLETLEDGTPLRLKGLPSIPSKLEPLKDPAAILCRTNAAAVASLLGGIEAGKRPHLVGGGADVLAFCEAVLDLQAGRPTSHPDLGCFGSWAEVEKYVEEDEGEDLRLWVKLVNGFGAQKIHDAVKHMPKEADADFVVCTAHKSKGREWDTVKLASDFPTNDRATDEERRLLYVAVTRAKLILDASECPFFTGEGCVDLTAALIASSRDHEHASCSVVQPTPAVPKQPAGPQSWSWAKGQDGSWLLRGPKGVRPGTRVQVERRDGSVSSATVGKVEQEWPDACLYRKG